MSRQLLEVSETDNISYNELINKVSDFWWDEKTKVAMMDDRHLQNALNKLQGFGKEQYEGSPGLRTKWIYILRLEQLKRADERKASFNKNG